MGGVFRVVRAATFGVNIYMHIWVGLTATAIKKLGGSWGSEFCDGG